MDRIDNHDPFIVRVTPEEFEVMTTAYTAINCRPIDAGNGVYLMEHSTQGVLARFRVDRVS